MADFDQSGITGVPPKHPERRVMQGAKKVGSFQAGMGRDEEERPAERVLFMALAERVLQLPKETRGEYLLQFDGDMRDKIENEILISMLEDMLRAKKNESDGAESAT